jgi:hypothetical protein
VHVSLGQIVPVQIPHFQPLSHVEHAVVEVFTGFLGRLVQEGVAKLLQYSNGVPAYASVVL